MLRFADSFLNRLSMYRLVSLALTSLWVVSIIFSFGGLIASSPAALIVSGVTAIIVSYVANRVFGYLFGVRPHGESAFISALILFFIFTPILDGRTLFTLAIVSGVAMASKYLLVWRGRHIANPVAIAAVFGSLTGVDYASWWIGTPFMLPFVAVFALLILYKTRRLVFGSIFLGVAVVVTVVTMMARGATLGVSLGLLLSWPLVFMVGFMLSEPLTLPPKAKQQYILAVIVALLATLPLRFGTFSISLVLAIVLGNIIAFAFSHRRHITLTLTERHSLTPTTDELVLTSPSPLVFEPGQYLELSLPHSGSDWRGMRRSFSMTSAPGEHEVRLGIKFYEPASSFKTLLRQLPPGSHLTATGTAGSFTLPRSHTTPLLFVAGGIGITPFISQLHDLMKRREQRDIILIYSISSPAELAYRDVLEAAGIKVIIVTRGEIPTLPAGWYHINDSSISHDIFMKLAPQITNRHAYISGPPAMIRTYKHLLHGSGVRRVTTDYFTGY
jgi:ferredoxin-NADP reductase